MNEEQIYNLLKLIIDRLKGKEFVWRLEGSINLKIQGVDVNVDADLDITTDDEGMKIFRKTLKKFIVKDFFSQKIKGHSIVCDINGLEVEINSYGDKRDMFDKIKKITWKNFNIPILPLPYAKQFYQFINYTEKVALIEKHLSLIS